MPTNLDREIIRAFHWIAGASLAIASFLGLAFLLGGLAALWTVGGLLGFSLLLLSLKTRDSRQSPRKFDHYRGEDRLPPGGPPRHRFHDAMTAQEWLEKNRDKL